jgi:hypothetical protein
MRVLACGLAGFLAVLALPLAASDIPDLGGIWKLNVEKSSWGKMQKPVAVVLEIEHSGLSVKYSGTVTYANDESRDFVFAGAIDGQDYPMMRSFGPGKCSFKRISLTTVESAYKSDDGNYVETSRIVISRDGRLMTRYMSLKSPEGERNWVEMYERR